MKKLEWFLNKNLPFKSMKDINEVLPKVPNMKWGALMNKAPTNKKVKELNKVFHIMENGTLYLRKKIIHTLMEKSSGKKTKSLGHKR